MKWVLGVVGVLIVVGVGLWVLLVDGVVPPPNLPPSSGYDEEVCGWVDDPAAVACFQAALENQRAADVYLKWHTIEGDPIYEIWRSHPGGGLTVYSDHSEDRFAGGRVWHWTCDGVMTTDDGVETVGCDGRLIAGWD